MLYSTYVFNLFQSVLYCLKILHPIIKMAISKYRKILTSPVIWKQICWTPKGWQDPRVASTHPLDGEIPVRLSETWLRRGCFQGQGTLAKAAQSDISRKSNDCSRDLVVIVALRCEIHFQWKNLLLKVASLVGSTNYRQNLDSRSLIGHSKQLLLAGNL